MTTNPYELTFIVSGGLSSEEREKAVQKIKALIEEFEGKLLLEHPWGQRELVYPIKQDQNGYFFTFILQLSPQKVFDFEKELRLQALTIRYLLLSLTKEGLSTDEAFKFEEVSQTSLLPQPKAAPLGTELSQTTSETEIQKKEKEK